jgi:hypothetical protein
MPLNLNYRYRECANYAENLYARDKVFEAGTWGAPRKLVTNHQIPLPISPLLTRLKVLGLTDIWKLLDLI